MTKQADHQLNPFQYKNNLRFTTDSGNKNVSVDVSLTFTHTHAHISDVLVTIAIKRWLKKRLSYARILPAVSGMIVAMVEAMIVVSVVVVKVVPIAVSAIDELMGTGIAGDCVVDRVKRTVGTATAVATNAIISRARTAMATGPSFLYS